MKKLPLLPLSTLPAILLRPSTLPSILLVIALVISIHPSVFAQTSIPLGGNAWSNHPGDSAGGHITPAGITDWTDPATSFTVWFRVSHPGKIDIALLASTPSGSSTISVSLGGGSAMTHTLTLKGARLHECNTGSWTVLDTGYQVVVIRGMQRSGAIFANIQSLSLSGAAVAAPVAFVPNNEDNFFYWGRRGPSIHFNYETPSSSPATSSSPASPSPSPATSSSPASPSPSPATSSASPIEYFYNEVTVPRDQDVIGSYFMADGFSVGYFGMQVNSPTERRILFSVWSPFTTDNPSAIPDSLKVRLVKKGQDVHTGSFGNEGSGGQSYLVYPWVAGRTYRFLLRAQPLSSAAGPAAPAAPASTPASARAATPVVTPVATPATSTPTATPTTASSITRFTAWFYAPEQAHWLLIASWDRPATHTWLQHLHSFLENFEPDYGDQGRRVLFSNQWTRDSAGHWTPITRARFTGDNTARKGYRLDYAGGSTTDGFWLRNGGFIQTPTPLDTWFTRPVSRQSPPDVDFAALP